MTIMKKVNISKAAESSGDEEPQTSEDELSETESIENDLTNREESNKFPHTKRNVEESDESDSTEEKEIENEEESDETVNSDENADSEENADSNSNKNIGWVDSISKILKTNKPKGKRSLVLSKAKKLTDVKEKPKTIGFQLETKDGVIKEGNIDPIQAAIKKINELDNEEPPRKKKKEINDIRIKPDILDKDREKTLSKIATKGVVQLFNAVKMQQKDIEKKLKEAGPLEVRKEKVLKNIDKRAFLDVLMGEKSENVDETMKAKQTQNKAEPTWNVLRDDFMMGAKLKDWDKELEQELENDELEVE